MTDREKLIELLRNDPCPSPHLCDCDCRYAELPQCFEDRIADHLIANGVTVQQWISVEDRLPFPNTPVLVFRPKMVMPILVDEYESYCDEDEEWQEGWARYGRNLHGEDVVTHWMPLPSTEGIE